MKIGSNDCKQGVAPTGADRKTNIGAPAQGLLPVKTDSSAKAPEASAKVELSASANVLAAGQADPTFDTAKVDRIAQAIRDGKFEVNAEAIADKLIQNAQELLGRKAS